MAIIEKELLELAATLDLYTKSAREEIEKLLEAANFFEKSWSGSWWGDQSRVYYKDFKSPPPGAIFSIEWGLIPSLTGRGSIGDWKVLDNDFVTKSVKKKAGNPDLRFLIAESIRAQEAFSATKTAVLSLIYAKFQGGKDKFLLNIIEEIEKSQIYSVNQYIEYFRPKRQVICRDLDAIQQGMTVPPHIMVRCEALSIQSPFNECAILQKNICSLANHFKNLANYCVGERQGTRIFLGHGRSPLWRELQDFLVNRLDLHCDEFNRLPTAGISTPARIEEMLNQAQFAFVLMTAEDEQIDGTIQARMNVIHEVGLFQGKLGFKRAIVLLEEGCEEFSNIHGLGQIRFGKGKILECTEEIRRTLEREGIIESAKNNQAAEKV